MFHSTISNVYRFVLCNQVYLTWVIRVFIRYNENIAKEPGHVDVYPASRIPKNLHHLVKPVNRSTSSSSRVNFREKGFRIITEPSTVSTVLQWTSDSEVQNKYFIYKCSR